MGTPITTTPAVSGETGLIQAPSTAPEAPFNALLALMTETLPEAAGALAPVAPAADIPSEAMKAAGLPPATSEFQGAPNAATQAVGSVLPSMVNSSSSPEADLVSLLAASALAGRRVTARPPVQEAVPVEPLMPPAPLNADQVDFIGPVRPNVLTAEPAALGLDAKVPEAALLPSIEGVTAPAEDFVGPVLPPDRRAPLQATDPNLVFEPVRPPVDAEEAVAIVPAAMPAEIVVDQLPDAEALLQPEGEAYEHEPLDRHDMSVMAMARQADDDAPTPDAEEVLLVPDMIASASTCTTKDMQSADTRSADVKSTQSAQPLPPAPPAPPLLSALPLLQSDSSAMGEALRLVARLQVVPPAAIDPNAGLIDAPSMEDASLESDINGDNEDIVRTRNFDAGEKTTDSHLIHDPANVLAAIGALPRPQNTTQKAPAEDDPIGATEKEWRSARVAQEPRAAIPQPNTPRDSMIGVLSQGRSMPTIAHSTRRETSRFDETVAADADLIPIAIEENASSPINARTVRESQRVETPSDAWPRQEQTISELTMPSGRTVSSFDIDPKLAAMVQKMTITGTGAEPASTTAMPTPLSVAATPTTETTSRDAPALSAIAADGRRDTQRDAEIRERQIKQQVTLALRAGSQEVRMQLYPPGLGQVMIRLALDGQKLRLSVKTESNEASDALMQAENSLREALSRDGFSLAGFDVHDDERRQKREQPQSTPVSNNGKGEGDAFSVDMTA